METDQRYIYSIAGESVLKSEIEINNPKFDQDFSGIEPSKNPKESGIEKSQQTESVKNSSIIKEETKKELIGESATEEMKQPSNATEQTKKNEDRELIEEEIKIYEFIKEQYSKSLGSQLVIRSCKSDPQKDKEAYDKHVNTYVKILMQFWKNHYVNFDKKSSQKKKIPEKHIKDDENSELSKKISKYESNYMRFIFRQGVIKDMKIKKEIEENRKKPDNIAKEMAKMQNERANFNKALNLHYGFERENLIEKKYMEKLIWSFREVNERFPNDGSDLFNWWKDFNKKKELKIDKDEAYTQDQIDNFYSDKAINERMIKLYKERHKNSPRKAKDLIKYWTELKVCLK